MKPILFLAILAAVIIPLFCCTGCAPAEEDADSVADTAIKGISGQGTITPDKPSKDAFGSDYQ